MSQQRSTHNLSQHSGPISVAKDSPRSLALSFWNPDVLSSISWELPVATTKTLPSTTTEGFRV